MTNNTVSKNPIINFLDNICRKKNTSTIKYILRNSWGQSIKTDTSWGYAFDNPSDGGWGDNGYGYLTTAALDAIKQDAWVITLLAPQTAVQ